MARSMFSVKMHRRKPANPKLVISISLVLHFVQEESQNSINNWSKTGRRQNPQERRILQTHKTNAAIVAEE